MRIQVLGDVAVHVVDDPASPPRIVSVKGKRHRLILSVLAARQGRCAVEDVLIEAIWGDTPPNSARTALQTYVSELRDLFEPDRPRRSAGGVIATDAHGYRLRTASENGVDIDIADLERAADPTVPVSSLDVERALESWGEPFAEFADHPELLAATARLREAHARTIERSGATAPAHGGASTDRLRAAIELYPYRERLVEQLAVGLYRSGDQRGALTVCREYGTRMRDDLGLDPGPRIGDIETAILDHDDDGIEHAAGLRDEGQRAVEFPQTMRPRRSTVQLVGRSGEIAQLREAFGESQLVSVTGPSGVGKTSLVWSFLDTVDAPVVVADLVELSVADEASIWRMLADSIGVGEQPHVELAASVADAVRLARAVVVLETAEVAPVAAAAVAGRLARTPDCRCIVTSQVSVGLAEARTLRISSLSMADATSLVLSRLDATLDTDPGELATLIDRLDRIPLALEIAASRIADLGISDTLRSLERRRELTAPDGERPMRHRSTTAAAAWSVAQLDPSDRAMLQRLAAHRGPFDLDTARHVWAVGGVDGDMVEQSVARLVGRSLLERIDDERGSRYRVLDTVRDAVVGADSSLLDEHEMRLASVVVETAQAAMFNAPSVLTLGQLGGGIVRAHDVLHAAGDERELVLAGCASLWWPTQGRNVEGLELIERALRAHKATAPPMLYQLVAGVSAFVSYATGDIRKTGALLDEMGADGMDELVPNVRLNIAGSAAFNSGRYDDAVEAYGELIDHHPEPTGPKLLTMWLYGNSLWYADRLDDAIEAYRDLRRTAESVDSLNSIGLSLRFEAMVHAMNGQLDRAWRLAERGLTIAHRLGDPSSVCQAEVAAAVVAYRSDALDIAEQYALDAIRTTLRPFDLFTQRAAPTLIAGIAIERDDPKRAALALGWYLDYLDRTGQLPVVATREMAARTESDAREALGVAEYGRLAGRGAALRLAELHDELTG